MKAEWMKAEWVKHAWLPVFLVVAIAGSLWEAQAGERRATVRDDAAATLEVSIGVTCTCERAARRDDYPFDLRIVRCLYGPVAGCLEWQYDLATGWRTKPQPRRGDTTEWYEYATDEGVRRGWGCGIDPACTWFDFDDDGDVDLADLARWQNGRKPGARLNVLNDG